MKVFWEVEDEGDGTPRVHVREISDDEIKEVCTNIEDGIAMIEDYIEEQ